MTHRIGILVFDGVTLLDASGPAEVFHLADPDYRHYMITYISPGGGTIRSASGIEFSTVAASTVSKLDTLLIAGGAHLPTEPIDAALITSAKALASQASRVASVCTGAFVLAELGLLNGRRATTHWRHASTFAQRYPDIRVEPDVIHIQDGHFLTSAGISAGIDLALAMVEHDLGTSASRAAAQELVMFLRRPGGQTQFSATYHPTPTQNEPLRGLVDAVLADPAAPHTVASMAAYAGVSERHLNRIFHDELRSTPAKWLEKVRVDRARALILDGHPITLSAQLCGFGSDETLRRAFARHLGTTPTAFRERFSSTRSP